MCFENRLFILIRPRMLLTGLHLQQEEESKTFLCCTRHFRYYETQNGGVWLII